MKTLTLLFTLLILSTPTLADNVVQETEGELEKVKQSTENMMKKAEADSDNLMKDTEADTQKAMSSADDLVKGVELEHQNPIADMVGEKLSISTDMAASGSSAMLALAENQLKGDNLSELNKLVPGLSDLTDISLTMGSIDSLDKVKSAFSKSGMDASQIAQFSPIILDYLKQKGASDNLLGSLSSVWSM
ncbi:hypothetical protein ACOMICROBIO_GDFFDHBD_00177 [Vibrio sp. B1REV9]|uniref:DUF2780 domain-containing protein n=1 Tax=Vibrio TaxID=662 RepID=UPI001AF6CEBF|nr:MULTISPECIES: DUF2780 domain-containing protein [Vibrio]BBM65798.1 hypothetical protein VA249_24440 [Vibrio alfacsensis]CAE6880133.1 hypothetical protein ACOMICROBIO_GDFFDHBD_00177 [Vibrio sp. B1REV9]